MEFVALAESMDQGKTIRQALELEIPRCAANLRYFANLVLNFQEVSTDMEGPIVAHSVTRHEPIGLVGVISPWNLPLYLLTWKIAPAIAMGNCVIAKPSELTSLTAFKLASLIKEAGFPSGVINIVLGLGQTAGQAIVEDARVKAISFTGGTATGRKIALAAASLGKKVSLELGGKNPAVVFADCGDLVKVTKACVRSSFLNQGEICLCTSRIYVEKLIFDDFLRIFCDETKRIRLGDPADKSSDMGPLISAEHKSKVLSYIGLAKSEGAKVLVGGDECQIEGFENGFFVPPCVLVGLKHGSEAVQNEIFGPVVAIFPFETEEEAITLANDTVYGLAASIWTQNCSRGARVARRIKCGVVWINGWMIRDLSTPFGGVKASGYGREGGVCSLQFFSDIKTITTALG